MSELKRIYGDVVNIIPQETWNNIFPDGRKTYKKDAIMEIFRKNYDIMRSLVTGNVVE